MRALRRVAAAVFAGPIHGGDGCDADQVRAEHPENSDVFFTSLVHPGPDDPDPAIAGFVADCAAQTGETPNGLAAPAHEAVGLRAAAITAEGSANPNCIGGGLHAIAACHRPSGTISHPEGQRSPRKSVNILKVADGRQGPFEMLIPPPIPAP